MIHPSCADVLATVQTAFDEQIVPHLADSEAKSAAATIGHLLRHVALRIEDEGQILLDDIARMRALLGQITQWLHDNDAANADAVDLPMPLPDTIYPSLRLLGKQALALRGALVAAQERVHRMAATHADDAGYQALRTAIRSYIASQLADEAKLIEPAFLGRGPRR